MVNFVDTILDTSQTGGVIKYNLTHADSTTEQVQLAMATPVQTQGTPLNKATFDSIQTDLTNLNNNKLNVSNKATQSEAEAGTNDTKYMTPLKVQQKIDSLVFYYETQSGSGSIDLTQWSNKVIEITGYAMQNQSSSFIRLNGEAIKGRSGTDTGQTTMVLNTYTKGLGYKFPFRVIIDQRTQTIFASKAVLNSDILNCREEMAYYYSLSSLSYDVGTPQGAGEIGFKAVVRISN